MDGLIVVLLIIGLVSGISKKKKKEQSRRRQAGFNDAAETRADGAKPSPVEAAKPAQEGAGAKVPYTKEEWNKFLREIPAQSVRKKEAAPAAAPERSAEGHASQILTAQRLRPAAQHMEGESRIEHAAHKKRIAEEEERLHREREELKELRNVNLKKLRSAVVMSEVLGKPVALRGGRRG